MEHHCLSDEEILELILRLQHTGHELRELLRLPIRSLRLGGGGSGGSDGAGAARSASSNPTTLSPDLHDALVRRLEVVRDCPLCRHQFETLWRKEASYDSADRIQPPDLPPISREDFHYTVASDGPAGEAAALPSKQSPCEITCVAEGMLVRILGERDGSATAILFLAEGLPEGVILRFDGEEIPFDATGIVRLAHMPVRIGIERVPPEPGSPDPGSVESGGPERMG